MLSHTWTWFQMNYYAIFMFFIIEAVVTWKSDKTVYISSNDDYPNRTWPFVASSVHTYIIGHYNPSVRIIDLVFHTTYVVYVNFIHNWRDILFKVDSERQIFWETFHGNFICSCQKFVFARNLLRGNRRINTFSISFWCLAWDSNPGFSSNKPTHYLLDHGDFIIKCGTIKFYS